MQSFKRLHVSVLMGFIVVSAGGIVAGEVIRMLIWMNRSEWLTIIDQIGLYPVIGMVLLGLLAAAVCTGRLDRLAYWKNTSPSIKAIPPSLLALFAALALQ